ncbi:acyl-CoA carboxylase subunit beta [Bacillus sonorensis]|uniref:acyl-CoA carboxylase subunit beta n=1 Tax=Bacillus sonorensis TaxID=119858 RepID=UPI00227F3D3F|nr:acyl-CoA carboxylase subunit beta [Bacillus sonorensis]MCY8034682.1 acyl-CoA carboxylase subunit beta [Bacillus sonorensis]MEC1503082.1 acyl-CoA carboxylase subunit beta [Bacillus sonorensis]MEC1536520.1 acyl-CoA carboxylase subunit beta [Bacillus sonorensis]
MNMYDRLDDLDKIRQTAALGGGPEKIDRQKLKGKLTARERIELLLDKGSFVELNAFVRSRQPGGPLGDGVVTGVGKIHGRPVSLFSQDFTVSGGALGEMHAKKIADVMDLAFKNKTPFIGLNDSGGARIQEGVLSLNGYGHIFHRNVLCSGVIPQISVILGPCAGGAVYSPALTDFVFMNEKTGRMFITGPKVIKTATGEHVSPGELGGASIHNSISGNAHFSGDSDESVLQEVRKLLSYLPQNHEEKPPVRPRPAEDDDLRPGLMTLLPEDSQRPYDVKQIIREIADNGTFFEVQKHFAKNAVIGFARIAGEAAGIVANQPKHLAGSLNIDAADKISRFIRFCDSFHIPILTLVDVPGFLPGIREEHGGVIRHGAKILYAYAEASVAKVTVIVRKAYGGAYVALNSKALGADAVFAWPNAEIAVMGAGEAADILFAGEKGPEAEKERHMRAFEKAASPFTAARHGMIDDIIDPKETRKRLIQTFDMLKNKRDIRPDKKHGNIPL